MVTDFTGIARRTTDSLSNLAERLIEADMGKALNSSLRNIQIGRTILSLLIIAFGITSSVLYVRFCQQERIKEATTIGVHHELVVL